MARIVSFLLSAAAFICFESSPAKALDLSLQPASELPAKVGDTIYWTAQADGSPVQFQYSVAAPGQSFAVIHDFDSLGFPFEYTPMQEGSYVVRVKAFLPATGESAFADAAFDVTSRVAGSQPVVSPTANPLVFLYSAPACTAKGMTVEFVKVKSTEDTTATTIKYCDGASSMNFWIAGLEPDTDYRINHRVWNELGQPVADGPALQFHTGVLTVALPPVQVLKQSPGQTDLRHGLLLQGLMGSWAGGSPVANKLDGSTVWYYDGAVHGSLSYLMRPLKGGTMLAAAGGRSTGYLRELDLAGNTVWETNPEAISTRLAAMEPPRPPIMAFHHDALLLPYGLILALAQSQRVVPAANPGDPARNVVGDEILLLDRGGNVWWVWDSFEKLDVNRKAILGETNGSGPTMSEDWTHSNSLQYLDDGNIMLSMRHQDWVVKIDFQDGWGSGDVLWRLGKDGDFTIQSSDAYPWFSHQHNPHYDGTRLWVYDNGNTRAQVLGDANSRGQVYVIDENARTASLEMNADLGVFSGALGSAQLLSNGNYQFLSGMINNGPGGFASQSAEVSPTGPTIRYLFQASSLAYRGFRMTSLYTPE